MGYCLTKIQTLEKQLKNYILLLTQFACDSTESNPLLDLLFLLLIKPGSVEKSKMNIVSSFTFLGRLIPTLYIASPQVCHKWGRTGESLHSRISQEV